MSFFLTYKLKMHAAVTKSLLFACHVQVTWIATYNAHAITFSVFVCVCVVES